MSKVRRMTSLMDREFVVFLIGMRINKWWRPDQWLPVAMAMPRMIEELEQKPELGLLGYEGGGIGNPSVLIQYWESVDKLMSYAKAKNGEHLPAWAKFMKAAHGNPAVGIWHETYVVQPDQYECVYGNFPGPFGLGKCGEWVPAEGAYGSARKRLGRTKEAAAAA